MTTEERTHHTALLEDVQREIRLLAEAHTGHTEHAERTEARFEQRFKEVEHQIMALDVNLGVRIGSVEAKLGARIGSVEAKLDSLGTKLSTELSRIATHLGLDGTPHAARPL